MKNILKRMKNKERSAYFVCSLSVKFPKCRPITVEGKVHGQISKNLRQKGFGYDSIFVPINSLTFGQMSRQIKSKIDHRYIAFKN